MRGAPHSGLSTLIRRISGGSLHAAEGESGHQPSRDAPITTRTRASIFAPEGFGSRNLLGTAGVGLTLCKLVVSAYLSLLKTRFERIDGVVRQGWICDNVSGLFSVS